MSAVIFVVDVTSRESFEELTEWLNEVRQFSSPSVVRVFYGSHTDTDEPRVVTGEEAGEFALANGGIYVEGYDESLLSSLATSVIQRREEEQDTPTVVPVAASSGALSVAGRSADAADRVQPARDYDLLLKLLLVGSDRVGKTQLMMRFAEEAFSEAYISTIGVDFRMQQSTIAGHKVKAYVWDTAGQERFRTITSSYYRGAQGMLFVFDLSNAASLERVRVDITEGLRFAPKDPAPICLLVGNKCDLPDRQVSREEGEALAREFGFMYIETSTKDNINVSEAFNLVLKALVLRQFPDYSGLLFAVRDPESELRWFTQNDLCEPWLIKDIYSYLKPG